MLNDLAQWVDAAAGKRVLLVGDLILDRYVYGDAERISPEAPVPVLRTVETREAVGGCANVAACLTSLGCQVTCCGVIGADRHGRSLRQLLQDCEICDTGLIELADRPTTSKTRLVGLAQHRHRQQLMRVDEEDATTLPEEASKQLEETVCRLIDECDVICVEDYDKGVITDALVAVIVAKAKIAGVKVLADPARLTDYNRYRNVDLLTPNRAELSLAVGRSLDSPDDIGRAGVELVREIDIETIVATADRDGAVVVRSNGDWVHLPTVPRSVYDNTGAGDAVLAMLAAAIAAGADVESATRLANIAGGLEVEKFGCVPIASAEILAELRLENARRNGKLRSIEELVPEISLRRDRGETVAFTNGCFDVLHAGHVDYLQRSKLEASILVVGLNGDASVRCLNKGADRPINQFEHRAMVLGALACVDYVVGFEEATPETLIAGIKPDVLIKGEDWSKKGVVGRDIVESSGGRVVLLPLVDGLSSTALIEKIRKEA